ncbi:MAG: hypothetical protein E7617_00105 [Ruminococcaceae bacterium]|nr:hypothetical protein [Oscillospiraceae bacterium]
MNIHIYGLDPRLRFCREKLLSELGGFAGDMLILPIPSTRDGKTVLGTDMSFADIIGEFSPGTVVAGYSLPKEVRALISKSGMTSVDVSRDEELLLANADLTAVGTVGRILTEESVAPSGLSVGIIGYGRIGQRLLYILSFLGAGITVFTSKDEVKRDLCMLGISGADSTSLDTAGCDAFSGLDILINTAPAKLISDSVRIPEGLRIIELASGENMPRGINYERFASVPAVMYPKSAGEALAASILRMIGKPKLQ